MSSWFPDETEAPDSEFVSYTDYHISRFTLWGKLHNEELHN
jgi:hypothetical protein